ncbi:MAG: PEP-CTERM sorting domain-containing protein [Akkermansiaceae bacterium]
MKPAIITALGAITFSGASHAAVVISSTAPTTNIISSNNTGTTFSRLFDEDRNANHARGQVFTLGAAGGANSAFQISAITIHKNGNQTFTNDTITLRVYEGTVAQWGAGTGHSTPIDGADYYVDTAVTPLDSEAFTLNGAIVGNSYVTFELATPIIANENSEFGFFLVYDESAASSPDYFQYNENGNSGRTAITETGHVVPGSRGMRYLVQGTAIPEPSSIILLGLSSLSLLLRRRK